LGGKAGVVFIGEGNDYIITSSVGEECKTVKRVGTQYEYHLQIDMGSKNRESRTFTVKKKGTPYQGKSEQKDVIANQNSIYLITEIKTKLGANERISEGTYLKEVGNKPVMACIEVTVPQELGLKVNVNEALKAVIAKPRVEAGNVIHTIVFDTHRFDELKAIVADYDKQIAELEAKANAEQDENVKKRLWAEQDRIQDTLKVQAEADLANAPIITIEGKGVNTLNVTDKTGKVVAVKCVTGDEDLMIINKSGIAIRFAIAETGGEKGRNTQGVKLIDLKKRNEAIASVCVVPHEEITEDENENENEDSVGETTENNNE